MLGSFEFLGKEYGYYMIMALIGALTSGAFSYIMAKKQKLNEVKIVILLLFSVIGVLIGGHLLYGITNADKLWLFGKAESFGDVIYLLSAIFGGQVFYGGLLGGILAGYIYAKATKLENFTGYADILAAAVPLFHLFGRIGCFLGGCFYGVESEFGFTFHNSIIESANGVNRFPVQLFEAGFNLCLFAVILVLLNKNKLRGKLFLLYMFIYAIGRFILEFFRGDDYRGHLFGLSTSQIIGALIFVVIIGYAIINRIKAGNHKKPTQTGGETAVKEQ